MANTARIVLLQLPAFSIEDAADSLAHALQRIDDAARDAPDLIALPEVTYPAYFIGSGKHRAPDTLSPSEAAECFAEKARQHRVYIAAGMALDAPDGGYTNSALLFGRDGEVVGRYDKAFLWHFDARWFAPGGAYPVFETDFGRVGILICADGRLPEIARSLTLNGAQIIIDLTAWVSTGRHTDELTTIQREFLMPVRAAENGVWIACADKCGVEAESLAYCGRSCFIDPRGRYAASLGASEEGILVHNVPMADAAIPVTRRPELYGALTQPTESLPIVRTLSEAIVLPDEEHVVAAVQMSVPAEPEGFLSAARRHAERLALHDAEIIVYPATPGRLRASYDHDRMLDGMSRIAADTNMALVFTVNEDEAGSGCRAMYLAGPRGVIAKHRQSHKPPGPRFETMPLGDDVCPVVPTPIGRVGMLVGAEAFVPEVARSLMLRGAEVILWATDDPGFPMLTVARCRAEENRVYVVCAGAPGASGTAAIIDPAGRVLAEALEGIDFVVSATVNRALSHIKARAPGTDVVRNRQPATYGVLTESRVAPEPRGSVV